MSILFSLWTVVVAIMFFAIVIWVLRADKNEMNEAAQIPFNEDESPINKENNNG